MRRTHPRGTRAQDGAGEPKQTRPGGGDAAEERGKHATNGSPAHGDHPGSGGRRARPRGSRSPLRVGVRLATRLAEVPQRTGRHRQGRPSRGGGRGGARFGTATGTAMAGDATLLSMAASGTRPAPPPRPPSLRPPLPGLVKPTRTGVAPSPCATGLSVHAHELAARSSLAIRYPMPRTVSMRSPCWPSFLRIMAM